MKALVLDAEAVSQLARLGKAAVTGPVVSALRAALEADAEVIVPAAVLSELYRGRGHDQRLDACLARHVSIVVVDTDRALARAIGHLLARADRGSRDHVDASVVAVALASGGGVILTGDPDDITHLAAGHAGISIAPI